MLLRQHLLRQSAVHLPQLGLELVMENTVLVQVTPKESCQMHRQHQQQQRERVNTEEEVTVAAAISNKQQLVVLISTEIVVRLKVV